MNGSGLNVMVQQVQTGVTDGDGAGGNTDDTANGPELATGIALAGVSIMADHSVDPQSGPTVEAVLRAVGEHYGILPDDLLCGRRDRRHSEPRQVAMYLCRDVLRLSYPELGRAFKRDHSTVHHGCQRVEDFLHDGRLSATVATIRRRLAIPMKLEAPTLDSFERQLTALARERDRAQDEAQALRIERNALAHRVLSLESALRLVAQATREVVP